jgi:hypothetical protein
MARDRIGELRDEIKHRDRRIEELRAEIDELRDLIRRMEENIEDYVGVIDRWTEAFGMEQTADGAWTWKPFWEERNKIIADYNTLVRKWNANLHLINGRDQPVGRPLAASQAQQETVRRLHKQGMSLRGIAEETSLGLQTVRTIVGKTSRKDRTSKREQQRIDIRREMLGWKRQHRTGNTLPKQAQRIVGEGRDLVKEAKGLGRAKRQ